MSILPLQCPSNDSTMVSIQTAFPQQGIDRTWGAVGDFFNAAWQNTTLNTTVGAGNNTYGDSRTKVAMGSLVNETLVFTYNSTVARAYAYTTRYASSDPSDTSLTINGTTVSKIVNALIALNNTVGATGTHLVFLTLGCAADERQFQAIFNAQNGNYLRSALADLVAS